ncbi:MAG: peptidoglycan DD-metalloendopeptidase family protein [Desulfobulbaceae bacterium]|nr:peptidoglycan DD-metalloendopeptidase family protein [Desulfobulbaceae bacterium]
MMKKKHLRNLILSTFLTAVLLFVGTITGLHNRKRNIVLQEKIASLSQTLQDKTVGKQKRLVAQVGQLEESLAQAKKALAENRREKLSIIDRYETQVSQLEQERTELFEGSISRLDKRSKIIKTMMDKIGVNIEVQDDPGHSGGLYIDPDVRLSDQLLDKTDQYLSLIQKLPLGRPINTKISSRYGRRIDPLNSKKAFHAGIDFKGRTGDKVRATGNAVVRLSSYSKGLGNHIILNHGNGYESLYAHLSKRLVKSGDKVVRGQNIGLVGNTGRSTGSHLHYEVHYRTKTVDPMKFMQVAKLISSK